MAEPPVDAGAVQLTTDALASFVAVTFVGAPGLVTESAATGAGAASSGASATTVATGVVGQELAPAE